MAESSGPERYAPRSQRPVETWDTGPEQSGPEKYAPPDRSLLETLAEAEHVTPIHRLRGGLDASNDSSAVKLDEIVQRASSASTNEIDQVIRMLDTVREMIRKEGERMHSEIASYVKFSGSATMAMKVIADNLRQWKDVSK